MIEWESTPTYVAGCVIMSDNEYLVVAEVAKCEAPNIDDRTIVKDINMILGRDIQEDCDFKSIIQQWHCVFGYPIDDLLQSIKYDLIFGIPFDDIIKITKYNLKTNNHESIYNTNKGAKKDHQAH
jgi:hypothetical protein